MQRIELVQQIDSKAVIVCQTDSVVSEETVRMSRERRECGDLVLFC